MAGRGAREGGPKTPDYRHQVVCRGRLRPTPLRKLTATLADLRSWSAPLGGPRGRCHRGPGRLTAGREKSKANLRRRARSERSGLRRKGQPVIAGYPVAPTPIRKFGHACAQLQPGFPLWRSPRGQDGPASLRPPAGRPARPRPSWPAPERARAQPRIRRSRSFSASPGRPRPEHGSS